MLAENAVNVLREVITCPEPRLQHWVAEARFMASELTDFMHRLDSGQRSAVDAWVGQMFSHLTQVETALRMHHELLRLCQRWADQSIWQAIVDVVIEAGSEEGEAPPGAEKRILMPEWPVPAHMRPIFETPMMVVREEVEHAGRGEGRAGSSWG